MAEAEIAELIIVLEGDTVGDGIAGATVRVLNPVALLKSDHQLPKLNYDFLGGLDDFDIGVALSVKMRDSSLTMEEHPVGIAGRQILQPAEPRLIERDPVRMAVARVGLVDSLFEADGVYTHRHPQVPVLGHVREIVHLDPPAPSDLLRA